MQEREREAGQPIGFRYFVRVHQQKWREKQTAATQPKKQQVRRPQAFGLKISRCSLP
jgi:hypothetical protein